tara:strand:- start:170 stop:970 length:801 start_codon:yes stop_codon:yes gene_type:complete
MGKFGSQFFEKSPIKEVAKGRAGRLRKRAQRKSERSGETGGYDYSDMKVLKLLGKAKRIEDKNFIKDTGAKKGSKRKGSMYGEDARVSASYDRPDSDSNSPLEGAYASGAGGEVYVSNRQDFQNLQDRITGATIMAIEGERDPETRSKRIEKRIERRNKRADDKGVKDEERTMQTKGGTNTYTYTDPKRREFDEKTEKLEKRKEGFDKEIEKQKKDRRSANFLSAEEKTDIVKNHYEGQGGKDWDTMSQKDKNLIIQDYKNIYGFY